MNAFGSPKSASLTRTGLSDTASSTHTALPIVRRQRVGLGQEPPVALWLSGRTGSRNPRRIYCVSVRICYVNIAIFRSARGFPFRSSPETLRPVALRLSGKTGSRKPRRIHCDSFRICYVNVAIFRCAWGFPFCSSPETLKPPFLH